jgi:hypothetical protein
VPEATMQRVDSLLRPLLNELNRDALNEERINVRW